MDSMMGLPLSTSKKNVIYVIVNRLTECAHFLPIRDTWRVERLAQLNVKEIARIHEIPLDIVSNRDKRFQTYFWQALQRAFEAKLNFSNSYNLETDGKINRVNQILNDMLRACVLEFERKWEDDTPLVEFSYNNS